MRAKQSTTQLTQSSLAQTILPSAANGRGRKSHSAEPPAPVVETSPLPPPSAVPAPLQTPMEFAGAPAVPGLAAPVWSPPSPPPPPPPAQTTAPAWSPPTPAAAPDWGMSASRFGSAPAAFGSAPANPQFGSAPATNYPVNYPAAPGFPPQPHYADSPATDYLPPVTAGQWVPQHAAPHHGGTQTAPPAYGPPPFGAPGYGGYPIGATPGRSTGSRVLIGLAIVLVGIVAIAVAIPVFLSQRKPVPVTLVLPQNLEGSTKLDSPALEQVQSTVESTVFPDRSVFNDPQAAFWGNGTPTFGVVAAKLVHRPTQSQTDGYWKGVERGATQDQVTLTKVPPGALGGTTECGMATGEDVSFLMCFSLDNSAAVYVIVYTSDMVQGTLMAEKLRGDIETH
jgi:hypothetical protein